MRMEIGSRELEMRAAMSIEIAISLLIGAHGKATVCHRQNLSIMRGTTLLIR